MTIPNIISLFRVALVPLICTLMIISVPFGTLKDFQVIYQTLNLGSYHLPLGWLIAGILYIIAALSDFVDGYLARKYHQVTRVGKFLDSIADKMLTSSVLIIMSCANIIPIWITLILILRDLVMDVIRQILATQSVVLAAGQWGKWKAATIMVGTTILLFVSYQHFDHTSIAGSQYGYINQMLLIPMYFSVILSIYSAWVYIYPNRKLIMSQGE